MRKFHPAYSAAHILVGTGAALWHGGYAGYGVMETAILVPFLIFFWWLVSDFSGGEGGTAREGVATKKGNCLSIATVSEPNLWIRLIHDIVGFGAGLASFGGGTRSGSPRF
ncbi:hypothetical protein [Mesorhizobium sp. B2-3-4]|uniref:hypothetical protein n=1 Tax=Mesorhizobium sp. B2-3-4 TaxID=2589959 RepID=UPI00112DAB9B|nr:hypothetical protein [Mesorhizobium sp. B2-3-4]TPM38601.1 hypothetical protein FJ967_11815 [Mesorhizobium sp. B2-3-4]